MKTFLVLFLALVASAVATREGATRSLQGFKSRTWCAAGAKLQIQVRSGKCWGTAEADCSAFSGAYGEWVSQLKEWAANKNCQRNELESYAVAHAKAVAELAVSAGVKVSCEGWGWACGYSFAEGSALARSFASAQAAAFVDADPNAEHLGTFCHADVEALADVYASVAEGSRAKACQEGWGYNEAWSSEFRYAVQCAVAQAYVRAAAKYCKDKGWGGYENEVAWSKCSGYGEVLWKCPGY